MSFRLLLAASCAALFVAGAAQAATIGVAVLGNDKTGTAAINPLNGGSLSPAEQIERNNTVAAANAAEAGLGATNLDAISYFIPLAEGANCFYGDGDCGLVSDSGNGNGTLKMWVKYSNVQPGGQAFLNTVFGDLDLNPVEDPNNFFESVQVFDEMLVALTGVIDDATDPGVAAANADTQQGVAINLGSLTAGATYYALFEFKTIDGGPNGSNTPEHMVTWISSTPIVNEVPLPAAAWMLMAGVGALGAMRKLRKKA